MMGLLLQGATEIGCLTGGDAWGCMVDAFVAATFGMPTVLGAIVGPILILGLYVASGYHPAPPSLGTMLIGGILLEWLPAQYHRAALTVMLFGFIAGIWFILKNYTMEVGR